MPRRSFVSLLLVIFSISFAFIQSLPDYSERIRSRNITIPEYQQYMENFNITESDPQGNVMHILRAEKLRTWNDNHTELEQITLSMLEDQTQTLIKARKGLVQSDHSLYLKGDVLIEQKNLREQRSVLISTDELYHFPDTGISQTDKAVQVTSPEGVINATGMVRDNWNRTLELKQNVSGIYEAP